MHSAKLSASSSRRRHHSNRDLDEDLQELSLSSSSRPSTQESKWSSYSRLSTDSGEGSLEDFGIRRNSSPVFWRGGPGRRHTAPFKKSYSPINDGESTLRPNTVHAWDTCSQRCSLSRYAPLPAIGSKEQKLGLYVELPIPVRRQCFLSPSDMDRNDDTSDANNNDYVFREDAERNTNKPIFSLTIDSSDTDSDFEDESENIQTCDSEVDDSNSKLMRPIIRSATFTIEKERPDIHGPFLTIAVRLPDGSRVSNEFDVKETMQNVCHMALQNLQHSAEKKWCLVTTDIPKRTFKDMTMSLKEAGINDKTLFYLQPENDSDSD